MDSHVYCRLVLVFDLFVIQNRNSASTSIPSLRLPGLITIQVAGVAAVNEVPYIIAFRELHERQHQCYNTAIIELPFWSYLHLFVLFCWFILNFFGRFLMFFIFLEFLYGF